MYPTRHNPNQVLMGATLSSFKLVTPYNGDPSVNKVGLAARLGSSDNITPTTGTIIGVSLGESLTKGDSKKCDVVKKGLEVPVRIKNTGVAASFKLGNITYTAVLVGTLFNGWTIRNVAGGTAGSEVVTVDVATKTISISMAAATSTATQIKAKWDAKADAVALFTAAIESGQGSTAQAAGTGVTASGTDVFVATQGAAAYIEDTTGEFCVAASGDTLTSGYFHDGKIYDGVLHDGTIVKGVALVNFAGGL